jgi:hypothetical protein
MTISKRLEVAETLTLEVCRDAISNIFQRLNTEQLERFCSLALVGESRKLTELEQTEFDELLAQIDLDAMTQCQCDFYLKNESESLKRT